MKKIKHISCFLLGLFVIVSCGKKDPSAENKLKFETVKYAQQSTGCDSLRNDSCAKIRIEFPQITDFNSADIRNKINQSIKSLFSMNENADPDSINFDEEMNDFISDYEEFTTEFPESFQAWIIEKTGDVKLNRGNIFSVDYMEYSYTGGAHANSIVEFKNYNLSNGDEITLDEIIKPDKQDDLTKIGETEFRKVRELSAEADLGQAGFWFENNEFYLNDNFLITDSSLVFYYNDYEITAYAYGPTELIIPLSKIKTLIDDKSLIRPLVE